MCARGDRDRLSSAHPRPPHGFRGGFLTGEEDLERAGVVSGPFTFRPLAVARPSDRDALSTLMAWASSAGIPIVPRGAGTGMPGGNVGPGVIVDLTDWRALSATDDGSVGVGPGTTGAQLERAAQALGRTFPALPSSAERCTLGGMIANNAAGARSFRHGSVRRWVRELDVVWSDGTSERLVRGRATRGRLEALRAELSGRRGSDAITTPTVAKNASGYAVDAFLEHPDGVDLVVGSEGTLGVVAGARVDTLARPGAEALALVPVPTLGDIDPMCAAVRALSATACEFLGGRFLDVSGLRHRTDLPDLTDVSAVLLVELAGDTDEVDDARRAIRTLARGAGVRPVEATRPAERAGLWALRHAASPVIAERARDGLVSMQFIEDNVVPHGRLGAYLGSLGSILDAHATDAVVFGHAGDGNVHVNPLIDVRRGEWRDTVRSILESTVDLVVELGGTLSGEHGDGRLRAPFLERVWGARAMSEFRRVRETLDPSGMLNPGVVLPTPGQDPLEGLTPRPRSS